MIEDLAVAIQEAEEIKAQLDSGQISPFHPLFHEFVANVLRRRQGLRRGEVEVTCSPQAWQEKTEREQEEYLRRTREGYQRGACIYSVLEALPILRRSGFFQHSPLRAIEKGCLERIFLGRPAVSWDMIEFVQAYGRPEELGMHYHAKLYMTLPCRCPDFYKNVKRKRA